MQPLTAKFVGQHVGFIRNLRRAYEDDRVGGFKQSALYSIECVLMLAVEKALTFGKMFCYFLAPRSGLAAKHFIDVGGKIF